MRSVCVAYASTASVCVYLAHNLELRHAHVSVYSEGQLAREREQAAIRQIRGGLRVQRRARHVVRTVHHALEADNALVGDAGERLDDVTVAVGVLLSSPVRYYQATSDIIKPCQIF